MSIYAVLTYAGSLVKFGYTEHLLLRLKQHQYATGFPVEVLGCRQGSLNDELAIHHQLSEWCVRGCEWYAVAEEVLAFARSLGMAEYERALAEEAARRHRLRVVRQIYLDRHATADAVALSTREYAAAVGCELRVIHATMDAGEQLPGPGVSHVTPPPRPRAHATRAVIVPRKWLDRWHPELAARVAEGEAARWRPSWESDARHAFSA